MKIAAPPSFGVDDRPLWDLTLSVYLQPVLTVADTLGLFGALDARPSSRDDLARAVQVTPRAIEPLLDVLIATGLIVDRVGALHLSAVARTYLTPGRPGYWGAMLALWKESVITHDALLEVVRSPQAKRPQQGHDDLWALVQGDDQHARRFIAAMDAHSLLPAEAVARDGHLAEARKVLDVGGGSGRFVIAAAQAHPSLRGTVMDLPAVCAIAQEYIEAAGVADRVDVVSADMFEAAWPEGHDAVFFSEIFHDWTPEQCGRLARNAFDALPHGGRIHVHEMLKGDVDGGPLTVAAYGVDMMMYTEGRQYSARELADLLRAAGFVSVSFQPTTGYFWLVSAIKP